MSKNKERSLMLLEEIESFFPHLKRKLKAHPDTSDEVAHIMGRIADDVFLVHLEVMDSIYEPTTG